VCTLKPKIIALILWVVVLPGCGITYGSYNPETRDLDFWMGKEYDQFVLYYKNGDEVLIIRADNVDAVEVQKLIKSGIVDSVKAGVKAFSPIPLKK